MDIRGDEVRFLVVFNYLYLFKEYFFFIKFINSFKQLHKQWNGI